MKSDSEQHSGPLRPQANGHEACPEADVAPHGDGRTEVAMPQQDSLAPTLAPEVQSAWAGACDLPAVWRVLRVGVLERLLRRWLACSRGGAPDERTQAQTSATTESTTAADPPSEVPARASRPQRGLGTAEAHEASKQSLPERKREAGGSHMSAPAVLPEACAPHTPLIYPPCFSAAERHIADIHLGHLALELRQSVLDELAELLQTRAGTANPIRNPLGWLTWACRQLRAGHMILTSLGVRRRERRERARSVSPQRRRPAPSRSSGVREAALRVMRQCLGRPATGALVCYA